MIVVLTLVSLRRYANGIGTPNTNDPIVRSTCCCKRDFSATKMTMKMKVPPMHSTMQSRTRRNIRRWCLLFRLDLASGSLLLSRIFSVLSCNLAKANRYHHQLIQLKNVKNHFDVASFFRLYQNLPVQISIHQGIEKQLEHI